MAELKKSTPLESLSALLKSLTTAQKRDFKKYAGLYGGDEDQRYVMLVQVIQRFLATRENESGLMEHLLARPEFGSKGAVNALARYAFERVLDSVRTRPEVSPRLNEALQLLQDVNFLFYKGLYHECAELVQRGLTLARALDRPTLVLEFLLWDRRVYQNLHSLDEIAVHFAELERDSLVQMRQLRDETDYHLLSNQLYLQINRARPLAQELSTEVNVKLFAVDGDFIKTASPMTRIWYQNSLHNYYDLQYKLTNKDMNRSGAESYLELRQACQRKIIDLYHTESVVQREEDPHLYNGFLDNYLNTCLTTGRFDEFERIEAELQSGRHELSLLRAVIYHRLRNLLVHAEFDAACRYIEEMELYGRIERLKTHLPESRLVALYFSAGQAYFLAGRFERALDWFTELYHLPRSKSLELNFMLSEIFMLLSQYETGPSRILPALQTLSNRVRRQKIVENVLLPLLDGIRTVVRLARAEPGVANRAQRLPAQIEELYNIISVRKNLLIFGNVLAWIEAKVNGTTITEEIRKYTALAQG